MSSALKVFISYTHKDEEFRQQLEEHLALLQRLGEISTWHDRKIPPGKELAKEIDRELEAADLILLLVSSTFIASDYCYEIEMDRALARHGAGEAEVVPILIRPCDWHSAPFGKLLALPKDGHPVAKWDDRDEAWTDVTRGLRRTLAEIRQRRNVVRPVDTAAPIFSVPFKQNPFFTGREEVLANLADQLKRSGRAALGQVLAISGLGGIGKTQTAVELAFRHADEYRAVFFVRAETEAELLSGFADVAALLGVADHDKDQLTMARAARRWLEANDGWLLILDNADTPALLEPYLPVRGHGHMLITSRAQDFAAQHIETERLAPPPEEEALAFLLRRTGRENAGEAERKAAAELADALGNLPLALEQAAAYLVARGCSFAEYLVAFRKKGVALLDRVSPQAGTDHPPLEVTWSLNFEEVQRTSPASADLLNAAAFLAPDAIPDELFLEGGAEISPAIAAVLDAEGPLAVGELVAPLLRYSLLDRDPEGHSSRVHRLVQETVKRRLGGTGISVLERTIAALDHVFPQPEFRNWQRCERLLPHLLAVAREAEDSLRLSSLLNHGGWYLTDRARLAEVEPLFQRALAIREKTLDADHPDVAMSLNNLAVLYDTLIHRREAEPLHVRALAIREEAFDSDHPDVAMSLINLASHYQALGRHSEAERLYLRALAIYENAFGADPAHVALSLNKVASLYQAQGRFAEAEPICIRALAIREKALGADHPAVATSLNNLASLYQDQGRFAEAEPICVRALAIHEEALGADHPGVATSLGSLASLYQSQSRLAEAEPICIRALAIGEKALGADHPIVATALGNLASLYQAQGRFAEAEPLYIRALAIREKALGADHPAVARSLNNLAGLYQAQGHLMEAEPLHVRALAIREKALGADHPDVAISLKNLASLYQRRGMFRKAEPLLKRALAIIEKALGMDHPRVSAVLDNLAAICEQLGRGREAKKLSLRARNARRSHEARERRP